ncbi:MAG: M23 family metallopeptidase [Acidobacteria bacterium]|nr:M23 family metallopeptidase [Acidobacteriota bacterium]
MTSSAIRSLRPDPADADDGPVSAILPLEYIEIDQDITELQAMLRRDWAANSRRSEEASRATIVLVKLPSEPSIPSLSDSSLDSPRPKIEIHSTSADSLLSRIEMPVSGVLPDDLVNTFGAPRDGGRRRHRGIDIFAPKGTPIFAVSEGTISFIGTESKAGKCIWLVNDAGVSFFYAHLDKWASGLYEGKQVRAGETIGYVGKTGNARNSGYHLHFAIHRESQAVNPYPYLVSSVRIVRAEPALGGGFVGAGAQ